LQRSSSFAAGAPLHSESEPLLWALKKAAAPSGRIKKKTTIIKEGPGAAWQGGAYFSLWRKLAEWYRKRRGHNSGLPGRSFLNERKKEYLTKRKTVYYLEKRKKEEDPPRRTSPSSGGSSHPDGKGPTISSKASYSPSRRKNRITGHQGSRNSLLPKSRDAGGSLLPLREKIFMF